MRFLAWLFSAVAAAIVMFGAFLSQDNLAPLLVGCVVAILPIWAASRLSAAADRSVQLVRDERAMEIWHCVRRKYTIDFALYLSSDRVDGYSLNSPFSDRRMDADNVLQSTVAVRETFGAGTPGGTIARASTTPVVRVGSGPMGPGVISVPPAQKRAATKRLIDAARRIYIFAAEFGDLADYVVHIVSKDLLAKCVFIIPRTKIGEAGLEAFERVQRRLPVGFQLPVPIRAHEQLAWLENGSLVVEKLAKVGLRKLALDDQPW